MDDDDDDAAAAAGPAEVAVAGANVPIIAPFVSATTVNVTAVDVIVVVVCGCRCWAAMVIDVVIVVVVVSVVVEVELELELGILPKTKDTETDPMDIGSTVLPVPVPVPMLGALICAAAASAADVVDVMNVVGLGRDVWRLSCGVDAGVEAPRVLMKIESSVVLGLLVLVLVAGKVTEMSDGKMLNVRMLVFEVEVELDSDDGAGAVESASADTVIGTIAASVDGATEPVIVVMEGFMEDVGAEEDGFWARVVVSVVGGTTIVSAAPVERDVLLELDAEVEVEPGLDDGVDGVGATIVVIDSAGVEEVWEEERL